MYMVSYTGFAIGCHSYGLEVYLKFQVFYTLYTKEDWSRGVTSQAAKDDPATHLRFSCDEKQLCKDPFTSKLISSHLRNENFPMKAICRLFFLAQITLDGHWWASTRQPKHSHARCQLSVRGRDPRACGTFQLPVWAIQGVAEMYSRKMSQIQVQTASIC